MNVFLSYDAEHASVAREIESFLETRGLDVITGEEAVQPGEQWTTSLLRTIESSDAILLLLPSRDSSNQWTNMEAAIAAAAVKKNPTKLVVPLFLAKEDVDRAPSFIQQFHGLDLSNRATRLDTLNHLMRTLTEARAAVSTRTEQDDAIAAIRKAEQSLARQRLLYEDFLARSDRLSRTHLVESMLFLGAGATFVLGAFILEGAVAQVLMSVGVLAQIAGLTATTKARRKEQELLHLAAEIDDARTE